MGDPGALAQIERYADTVPRASAAVERIGPFSLFVSRESFPFYARPALGCAVPVTVRHVQDVRARQRELGVPEAFEWLAEVRSDVGPAVSASGLTVYPMPLLIQRSSPPRDAPPGITVRALAADDPAVRQVQTAIGLGFAQPGTAVGPADEATRAATEPSVPEDGGTRARLVGGLQILVGAFSEAGAVGGGSCSPRGPVAEITGVSTLPAYRRRGIGAAVTAELVRQAHGRGVELVFLSAGSAEVARVYVRAGFERIGTACVAGSVG